MIINETQEIKKDFFTEYKKVTKHRKKCNICNKLIKDGEEIRMALIKTEKYYPVKGIMKFTKWSFQHKDCFIKLNK